jgi:hypothetical protein
MNTSLYIISFIIFYFIELNINKNKSLITIYKSPIFKLIFLFAIYLYGENNYILSLLTAVFYVYIGQKIQQIELLN